MVDFFFCISRKKKVENTKIYTKAFNLLATGFAALGQCLFQGWVHWFVLGAVVEAAMHVFLWDAKGSELYMHPLIQPLHDKGIPLTTKALGFQHLDGWTYGYQSLSFLRQLLQTEPSTDLGMFTAERMPPAFVTHVQDIVNNAP